MHDESLPESGKVRVGFDSMRVIAAIAVLSNADQIELAGHRVYATSWAVAAGGSCSVAACCCGWLGVAFVGLAGPPTASWCSSSLNSN